MAVGIRCAVDFAAGASHALITASFCGYADILLATSGVYVSELTIESL